MNLIKKAVLWIKIRAVEGTAQGYIDTMPLVRCEETLDRMVLAHLSAIEQIEILKAEYRKLSRGRGIRAVAIGG